MRADLALLAFAWLVGCSENDAPASKTSVPGRAGALKSTASVRAERRLFDGAPPVIPHPPLGASCVQCHNEQGMEVADLGFAPPSPHELTRGMSAFSRCNQCHVHRLADDEFVANTFAGLAQDLRLGERLYDDAPPVMPHARAMRENCVACHSGPAAREEVRCSHPERTRCEQCHASQVDETRFSRS